MGLGLVLFRVRRGLVHWLRAKGVPFAGEPLRAPMTNWLNPARLAAVAVEAVISGLFGEFADRREAQAAIRKDHHDETTGFIDRSLAERPDDVLASNWCDYRSDAGDGAVWVDYLADTGDGWNATYAMASLLNTPQLQVADPFGAAESLWLPRGKLLVMGGDQVYPVASPEEYDRRLVRPFRAALGRQTEANKGSIGELFAVPGNHDWYDGLKSFMGTFCRQYDGVGRDGKVIGARRTQQSRSYFAIKLPYDWWLWGLDSQLTGYIDQPQVDYFSHVAKIMHKQAEDTGRPFKLIIFTGYPSWTRVDPKNPNPRFGSYSYMERLINNYGHANAAAPDSNGKVCLAISGDTHHYARHTEDGPAGHTRQYITCGGGGAYTHPTGQVGSEQFRWHWPMPGEKEGYKPHGTRKFVLGRFRRNGSEEEAVYPGKAQSRRMSWEALLIAPRNLGLTLLMSAVSLAVLRIATIAAAKPGGAPVWAPRQVPSGEAVASYAGIAEVMFRNALSSAIMLGILGLMIAALAYAADRRSTPARVLIGTGNAVAQISVMLAVGAAGFACLQHWPTWLQLPVAALAGGFAATTALGAYFLVCYHGFGGMHWNELFLGLRSTRCKSMLRMKFDPQGGLTIFPIGLDDCEKGGIFRRVFGNPAVRMELQSRLIEPPIEIR